MRTPETPPFLRPLEAIPAPNLNGGRAAEGRSAADGDSVTAGGSGTVGSSATDRLSGDDPPVAFHLLRRTRGARLLAVRSDGDPVRLNGVPMPRLAVLFDGDRIRLADGRGFEVVLPRSFSIGPAGPEIVGKPCPVCRASVEVGESVLRCACGTVVHCAPSLEGLEGKNGGVTAPGAELGADSEDCAGLIHSCPVCGDRWGQGADDRDAGELRS